MANTVELMVSPEEPPVASYATGRRSSPVSLADARALPVSVVAEAGASLGRVECLGHLRCVLGCACVLAGRRFLGWPSSC